MNQTIYSTTYFQISPQRKCVNVSFNAMTTSNNNNILTKTENRLPKSILDKAIKSGNEFGWTQTSFLEVVEIARQSFIAIVGGQIQYVLSDGTCELYWLNYDPDKRKLNEGWLTYCNRTAKECVDKFNKLISTTDIEKEATASFGFLADKKRRGVNINDYLAFILYFDDKETDLIDKEQSK